MTGETKQKPHPSPKKPRSRRKKLSDTYRANRAAEAPRFKPTPGRPRILDPDQRTLDENVQRL
jgi:hypothetical protein